MKGKDCTSNNIVTDDGLFYSNFTDSFRVGLAIIPGTDTYSEYLVWLKENYGIKISKPQKYPGMKKDTMSVGVYIVNYQKYLKDLESKYDVKQKVKRMRMD